MRVYLSGGMQYAARSGAQWRADIGGWLKAELGHTAVDPVVESRLFLADLRAKGKKLSGADRTGGDWPAFFRLIVARDVRLVRSSDYVICLWNRGARLGAGTQGELTIARDAGIPVYLVTRSRLSSTPGWIQGCTTQRFNGFRSLRQFLHQRYVHE